MLLQFTKMHGTGNDFMLIDAISQHVCLRKEQIQQLADRHFGVGFDQLLLVEPPDNPAADFRYRIFNADGNEVEQCGNGARCFALFVRDKSLTCKNELAVETQGGLIELHVKDDNDVLINMGVPDFTPKNIPFSCTGEGTLRYSLIIDGEQLHFGVVSMGNPHAVIVVDNVKLSSVENIGSKLSVHEAFPQGVNVGFMQILNSREVRLRVYERGVGETLACGSGACAAMAVARKLELVDAECGFCLTGGRVNLIWQDDFSPIMLSGPATKVFDGKVYL